MYVIVREDEEYGYLVLEQGYKYFDTVEKAVEYFKNSILTPKNIGWNNEEDCGPIEESYFNLYLEEISDENNLLDTKNILNTNYFVKKLERYE